ncbi:phage protein NinX family protein [Xenorhabdus sp. KK7.4]|uniref:phage protein NinX family protein n=1 Tax=Xenorhabdus sp. KK7.4 TaxID=1851572 RepID=UPI000C047760|nr:phage protein NinX family protein [Xenorhabdus sp. KK7.4]PHM51489.1 hypothetical protein Xekk_03680 [Xenorhabdus sp. KK7.4]
MSNNIDYSKLSDFEINKMITERMNISNYMYYDNESDYVIWVVPSNHSYEGFTSKKGREFDPCNNPQDAMPIIINNGISLIFQDKKFEFATNDGEIECTLDNPYKAAMVIFLHMKDMENEIQPHSS